MADLELQEMLAADLAMPPEELIALRSVFNGQPPRDERERFLKTWKDTKPSEFMAAKTRAESAYRMEQKLKMQRSGPEVPVEPSGPDEGTEKSLELLRGWLRNRSTP